MAVKEMLFSQCVTTGFSRHVPFLSSYFCSLSLLSPPHPQDARVKCPVHRVNRTRVPHSGSILSVQSWHSCMVTEVCSAKSIEWVSEGSHLWEGLILAVRLTYLLPGNEGPMGALDCSHHAWSRNMIFSVLKTEAKKMEKIVQYLDIKCSLYPVQLSPNALCL